MRIEFPIENVNEPVKHRLTYTYLEREKYGRVNELRVKEKENSIKIENNKKKQHPIENSQAQKFLNGIEMCL